jgi:hypothetical protein
VTENPADQSAVYRVDARGVEAVLVGDQGIQINYIYQGTWTDGVAPAPLVTVSGAITSPYRGLNAFEQRDVGLFFGRESAAAEVLERMSRCLDGPGLLVVSGVSGAGKSSLLRAGVLPRIRGAGLGSAPPAASWPCLVFTRGPLRCGNSPSGSRRSPVRTPPPYCRAWPMTRPGSRSPPRQPRWPGRTARPRGRKTSGGC